MKSTICDHVHGLWDDYRTGSMPDKQCAVITAHLETCPECRKLESIVDPVCAAAREAEMEPLLKRRLEVAAANRRLPPKRTNLPRRALNVAALTAAAASIAGLVMLIGITDERDVSAPTNPISSPIPAAVHVTSLNDGRQMIEVFPGTALWLDIETAAQVVTTNTSIAHFRLNRGLAVAEVGAHVPGFRFVVATPFGEVEARGTVFSIRVDPAGRGSVRVVEGFVEVRLDADGSSQLLTAGEELIVGRGGPSLARRADLEGDRCLALGCSSSVREEQKQNKARLDEEPRPSNSAAKQSQGDKPTSRRAVAAIEDRRFDDATALVEELARSKPRAAETRDLFIRLARAYRRAGLFQPAADAYNRLIARFPGSDAATNSLVPLAQIEQEALDDPREALGHFEAYLRQKPGGFLAEAARAGKVRSLNQIGRHAAAIDAVNRYFEAHPDGVSAAEMLRRRGDAQSKLGRGAAAIRDYQQVITRWPESAEGRRAAKRLKLHRGI